MPTSTLKSVAFENVGPLTTTFTAPPECQTGIEPVLINSQRQELNRVVPSCQLLPTDIQCRPSSSKILETLNSRIARQTYSFPVFYYSPGLACPASWTAVGTAVRDGDGSLSTTGVFQPTVTTTTSDDEVYLTVRQKGLANALDKGETAIACCPSGFSANIQGFCYSTVPSSAWTATEYCQWSVANGNTYTGPTTGDEIYPVSSSGGYVVPFTTQLDRSPSAFIDYVPMVAVNMVNLVHKEADLAAATTGDDGEGASEGDGSPDSGTGGGPRPALGTYIALISAVWAVGAVAGILLITPL